MDGLDVEAYPSALVGLCHCAHMVYEKVSFEHDCNIYSHVIVGA